MYIGEMLYRTKLWQYKTLVECYPEHFGRRNIGGLTAFHSISAMLAMLESVTFQNLLLMLFGISQFSAYYACFYAF